MSFLYRLQSSHCVVILAVLSVTSGEALALGRGQDPTASPVVIPDTQTQTSVWKLAGTVLGASGVQIAPQWILSAKHVIPSQPSSGSVFRNALGSAVLGQCYWPSSSLYTSGVTPDIVLCKLNTAIPAPAGSTYPQLVQNPATLANGAPLNIISPNVGAFLAIGFGNPTPGQARYAWVDMLGMPYTNYTPGSLGWNAPLPYRDSGDSGSPTFWFGSTSAPALVGLTTGGGPIRLDTTFDQNTLNWIRSTVASNSADVVSTALTSEYFGSATQSPPWLDKAVITMPQSTATSVTLNWKTPSAYSSLVKRYLVTLEKDAQMSRSLFVNTSVSGMQSTTLTGLETNTNYLMCVIPSGLGISALGEAALKSADNSGVVADFSRNCTPLVLSPAADAVQNLSIRTYFKTFSGVGTYPTYSVNWTAPSTPANIKIVGYRTTEKVNSDAEQTTDIMGTSTALAGGPRTSGERICVTITPITSPMTIGTKSSPICATMP